jgi:hypothetical protein
MRTGSSKARRVALGMLLALAVPAAAHAGKFCGDLVEGGRASGATQEEALIAAQKWWSSRAGALGPGYENWDNADNQSLECLQGSDGRFVCKAMARPCLPEGILPENVPKLDL